MFKRLFKSHAARRRLSWIITAVLILPFIIFFHATGRTPIGGPGGSAGRIFGKSIPWELFEEQRLWLMRQWQQQLGEFPRGMDEVLAQYAWDRLILAEEARRERFQVDDRELAEFIRKIPVFQEAGRFSAERYHRLLRATGMPAPTFELLVRRDLLVDKLVESVKRGVTVSDEELRRAYAEREERLEATLFVFQAAAFRQHAEASVTEEALRAEYEAHPEAVRTPEQLVMDYLGAERSEIASPVDEAAIRAFYDQHPELFRQPDGTVQPFEAAQGSAKEQASEAQTSKRLTSLALDLQEDLDSQLRFEEIAAVRGLTPRRLGPLAPSMPWTAEGAAPELIQAVAELPPGALTDAVRTSRGVYVARVAERLPATVPPFELVRAQLRERLLDERAREAARQEAEALRARLSDARAAGIRFEEAALSLTSLPAQPVSFTRSGPVGSLGEASAVNDAAFQTRLGELTPVIQTGDAAVFLRPEARVPAEPAGFEQAREALRQELVSAQQSTRFASWLEEVRARAKLHSYLEPAPAPTTGG